jgi:hypothetical protein
VQFRLIRLQIDMSRGKIPIINLLLALFNVPAQNRDYRSMKKSDSKARKVALGGKYSACLACAVCYFKNL